MSRPSTLLAIVLALGLGAAGCGATADPEQPEPALDDDDDDAGDDDDTLPSLHPDDVDPDPAPEPPPPEPAIVLTFDDRFIDQWSAWAPLMESYGARVTFFVTRWDLLTTEEVDGLHALASRGHEIGHHSLTHENPNDFLDDHTVDEYVQQEIVTATELMEGYGFTPTSFAYPWGGQSGALDAALSEHFDILRGSARVDDLDRILHYWDGQDVIKGGRLDSGYAPVDELITAMDLAVDEEAALVLYAHRIFDEGEGSHITPAELEQMLELATDRGMSFATISELATPRR